MNTNEYTLSLIDNYIEATGLGEAKRLSLSPADYILFRKQAVEECGISSHVIPVAPAPVSTHHSAEPKSVKKRTEPVKHAEKKDSAEKTDPKIELTSDLYEEEENSLEALLRGVPG